MSTPTAIEVLPSATGPATVTVMNATLPAIIEIVVPGVQGPPGAPGPQGPPGKPEYSGIGPPGVIVGATSGQMYMDEQGTLYTLGGS